MKLKHFKEQLALVAVKYKQLSSQFDGEFCNYADLKTSIEREETASQVINDFMDWTKSREGKGYWQKVYNDLQVFDNITAKKDKERIFKILAKQLGYEVN